MVVNYMVHYEIPLEAGLHYKTILRRAFACLAPRSQLPAPPPTMSPRKYLQNKNSNPNHDHFNSTYNKNIRGYL